MKFILITLVGFFIFGETRHSRFYRTFQCVNQKCRRTPVSASSISFEELGVTDQHPSLEACVLVCGKGSALWPIPSGTYVTGSRYRAVHPKKFSFNLDVPGAANEFVFEASNVFVQNLQQSCRHNCNMMTLKVEVNIKVFSSSLDHNWNTKEDYNLDVMAKGFSKLSFLYYYATDRQLEIKVIPKGHSTYIPHGTI
ncbi:uncharacterized protein LOC105697200, partial [Orussus abietinus]|uniref:uncharacterized protein LOC105697200 n=1 Tax=Orussus abietinus TaxID=222816 RepID=UPI000C71614F